jgi:hypothetical protein
VKVEEGKYSIAEIVDWLKRHDLVVNAEYQRGGGLWPVSAKSYFIDTILKEFPFPKVYFHERIDKVSKRPHREIVDGQQRLTTLVEFVDGKFALGKNALNLGGMHFSDLTEDQQNAFYAYTVSVDVIRNADRAEILQMFRRMNAYTLPLNAPEKRHSEFFGEFKGWVNNVLDQYGAILINWKVYTSRQVVRMVDAEFVADVALAIEEGIVSTSPKKLIALYKKYDDTFDARALMTEQMAGAFDVILTDLSEVQKTYITKAHIFHSFFCALLQNRFGLPGGEEATGIAPIGVYFSDRERALVSLKRLAAAHEEKDTAEFAEYVNAASEGGNRAAQRAVRIKWLCNTGLGPRLIFLFRMNACWRVSCRGYGRLGAGFADIA